MARNSEGAMEFVSETLERDARRRRTPRASGARGAASLPRATGPVGILPPPRHELDGAPPLPTYVAVGEIRELRGRTCQLVL
eukprot:12817193-Prorocentrum_lima.AAC.1